MIYHRILYAIANVNVDYQRRFQAQPTNNTFRNYKIPRTKRISEKIKQIEPNTSNPLKIRASLAYLKVWACRFIRIYVSKCVHVYEWERERERLP